MSCVLVGSTVGRLAVRASGSGTVTTARHGVVQGIPTCGTATCCIAATATTMATAPVLGRPSTLTQRRVERPAPAQEAPEIR